MPYTTMETVPANIKQHKNVALTLEQVNKWAEIYDSLKNNSDVKEPAAAAWSIWEEIYELKDDAWVLRKREAAESMLFVEDEVSESLDVVELGKDGLPSKIRVMVIQAGPAATKNRNYPKETLMELAESGKLDNLKMYDQHAEGSEKIPGAIHKARSIRDYLSYLVPGTAEFVDNLKLKTGEVVSGITAVAKLIDKDFKYKVAEAAETLGLSLSGVVDGRRMPTGETIIESVRKAVSLDWLTGAPNCGGRVLEIVEAAEPGTTLQGKEVQGMAVLEQWSDLTLELLKANRADIYDLIKEEVKKEMSGETEQAVEQAKADAAKEVATVTEEKDKAVSEAADLKKQLEAKTTEIAESQAKNEAAAMTAKVIEVAEQKCAGLNILGKAQVLKSVLGKSFKTEEEIAEAVDTEVAKHPQTKQQQPAATVPTGGNKSSMSSGSLEVAESIGMTDAEIKRLRDVR